MVDISFLRKKLNWKDSDIGRYQFFDIKELETIKHFVENNKEYYYLISENKVMVVKQQCKTIT